MADNKHNNHVGKPDEGLSQFFRAYRQELCAYVRSTFGQGPPEPEDVVQQAFAQFARLDNPNSIDNPRAYLYRTAHNIVIEYHRAEGRRRRFEASPPDFFQETSDDLTPETVLMGRQRLDILKRVVLSMSEQRRQSFVMNRIHGLSCAEIARRTGFSESGVKKHISLALAELEAALTAVLIENFRPGVMKRLGLDYGTVNQCNPALIYLSLPGFASNDRRRKHIQAWEGILGAAACAYTQLSIVREGLNFRPVYIGVPICSTYGAVLGAVGIMAALLARENHGIGTQIEMPLVEAGLIATTQNMASLENGWFPAPPSHMRYTPEDLPAIQAEKLSLALQELTGLGSKFYSCAGGRKIYISIYLTCQFAERFFRVLGIDRQLKEEGFVNVGPWEAGLNNDVGNTPVLSAERKARLTQLVSDRMRTRTAFEWEDILAKAGIPATVIRTRDEYLALEPMRESEVLTRLGDGATALTVPSRLGDVSGPGGAIIKAYSEAEDMSFEKANALFDDRDSCKVLPKADISLKKGDLLKGLKVLDLCNVIAGPTSSHLLAEYGADVIKAEAPDGVHPMFLAAALELNQGKRSIVNDVKTAPGRGVFKRLVSWADIVVHNCLDDKARRLGVAHDQLLALNPKVVSCQLSGNGGTWRGGWEQKSSFDNLIQGLSGLLVRYGSLEYPQWHGAISSADTIGGYSLAYTSLLAVWQQRRTGYAGEARTSLIRATNHYQLPDMIAEKGKNVSVTTSGQFSLGENLCRRLYRCRDGWIYVSAVEKDAQLFIETVTGSGDVDEVALEASFAEKEAAHWFEVLLAAGIACHPVMNAESLKKSADMRRVDNQAEDEDGKSVLTLLRWEDHPCGAPVIRLAAETGYIGECRTVRRIKPAPSYGKHSREVLAELGYRRNEIEELIRLKVVHDYLPGIGCRNTYFFKQ